ncbi:hypothetical protein AWC04_14890 [Mycolicibacterium fallax]|uniref:Uncharacterized protein n=1 Tax=Mycolicibacterium fallax TaxID=1793 RepID=A0A1X1R7S8_MYCFA|nr:hypothetical protein AWC04_14890 [Mycolicibacterium fallax]
MAHKRADNRAAATRYRAIQRRQEAEALEFVANIGRLGLDDRRDLLVARLDGLPDRGSAAERKVLEAELADVRVARRAHVLVSMGLDPSLDDRTLMEQVVQTAKDRRRAEVLLSWGLDPSLDDRTLMKQVAATATAKRMADARGVVAGHARRDGASESEGHDLSSSEVVSPPKKESKALTEARAKLQMAQRANASAETIDLLQARVDKLTAKPKRKSTRKPEPANSQVQDLIANARANGESDEHIAARIQAALDGASADADPENIAALRDGLKEVTKASVPITERDDIPTLEEFERAAQTDPQGRSAAQLLLAHRAQLMGQQPAESDATAEAKDMISPAQTPKPRKARKPRLSPVYDESKPIPPSGHRIPADADVPFGGRIAGKLTTPEAKRARATNRVRAAAVETLTAAGAPNLAQWEAEHVLAVAQGQPARWVADLSGGWVIAAPMDELRADNTVEIHHKDGSSSIRSVRELLAEGTVNGRRVGVFKG